MSKSIKTSLTFENEKHDNNRTPEWNSLSWKQIIVAVVLFSFIPGNISLMILNRYDEIPSFSVPTLLLSFISLLLISIVYKFAKLFSGIFQIIFMFVFSTMFEIKQHILMLLGHIPNWSSK